MRKNVLPSELTCWHIDILGVLPKVQFAVVGDAVALAGDYVDVGAAVGEDVNDVLIGVFIVRERDLDVTAVVLGLRLAIRLDGG